MAYNLFGKGDYFWEFCNWVYYNEIGGQPKILKVFLGRFQIYGRGLSFIEL